VVPLLSGPTPLLQPPKHPISVTDSAVIDTRWKRTKELSRRGILIQAVYYPTLLLLSTFQYPRISESSSGRSVRGAISSSSLILQPPPPNVFSYRFPFINNNPLPTKIIITGRHASVHEIAARRACNWIIHHLKEWFFTVVALNNGVFLVGKM